MSNPHSKWISSRRHVNVSMTKWLVNMSSTSVIEVPFLQYQELSQLSHYNFTSVTCEKSASSLTLPNATGFLKFLL
jgi:hypothetical protein